MADNPVSAPVYLAARYSRRLELCGYAAELESHGYTVTSRWLLGNHQAENDQLHRGAEAERFAAEDIADVDAALALISFGEQPRTTTSRGGRHVEFGYALAKGIPICVVGPREHVFTCLVDQVETWEQAVPWLAKLSAFTATTRPHDPPSLFHSLSIQAATQQLEGGSRAPA